MSRKGEKGKRIRTLRPGEEPVGDPRRYKSDHGYIRLRWKDGNELVECYEHRWVTRCFDADKQVHHINGVKDDNRIENLEVLTASEHRAEHATHDGEEMARMYREGMSLPEVGVEMGCASTVVLRALRRVGQPTRTISEALTLPMDEGLIRRLHDEGVSNRRIAAALGVSPSTIDVRVRRLGLTPPTPGRRCSAAVARASEALRAEGLL